MASQTEWSHDFCLSCDRQIAEGGTYCSQACRLAELEEKAGTPEQQTPPHLSSSASSTSSSTYGFYLPPAVNFSAFKTSTPSRGFDMGPSYHYYPTTNGLLFTPPALSATAASSRPSPQRSLTPSSSRSSLASTASQPPSGISALAASQLNSYMRSFDQVRDLKRRYTQY